MSSMDFVSIHELFDKDMIEASGMKLFNYCSSVIAYNEGGGKFRIEVMPIPVQLSSINAVELADLNKDGIQDILLGGNKFGFPPQFGRLDASYGHVLLNSNRKLTYVESRKSGMSIRGEVKGIKMIHTSKGPGIVAIVNDEKPVVYLIRNK